MEKKGGETRKRKTGGGETKKREEKKKGEEMEGSGRDARRLSSLSAPPVALYNLFLLVSFGLSPLRLTLIRPTSVHQYGRTSLNFIFFFLFKIIFI